MFSRKRVNAFVRVALLGLILVLGGSSSRPSPDDTPPVCEHPLGGLPFQPGGDYFNQQWYHRNPGGTAAATVDADADTPLAWECTTGSPKILIALIEDKGTQIAHDDLAANRFCNTREDPDCNGVPDNPGVDDDQNSFIDDVCGWNFIDNKADLGTGFHGTAMAGLAAARPKISNVGVWGACPNCRFLPIRADWKTAARAIDYARSMGARIISVSPLDDPGIDATPGVKNAITTAINQAAQAGAIIIIGAGNRQDDMCQGHFQGMDNIVAVSSSTSRDTKAMGILNLNLELDKYIDSHPQAILSGATKTLGELKQQGKTTAEIRELIKAKLPDSTKGAAIGNCIDILAPSWHEDGCLQNGQDTASTCTLGIASTDTMTGIGLNNVGNPCGLGGILSGTDVPNVNYTRCFGGVSSSRALASGVAGLLLSVQPGLTKSQVQRLLEDTADKIEPSKGQYDANTGFSSPLPSTLPATHAWGRINAFEAVRIMAPGAHTWSASGNQWKGGGGVDIFLRDNSLDWGNTEQPSSYRFDPDREANPKSMPCWESPDIKVDAPDLEAQPPLDSKAFDAFKDDAGPTSQDSTTEGAIGSKTSDRVYVRVRNRGPSSASDVAVWLYWAWEQPGNDPNIKDHIPRLPGEFWAKFSAGGGDIPSEWHPIACSGTNASADGTPEAKSVVYPCRIPSLPNSGASVAGCPGRGRPSCDPPGANDEARVVSFPFEAPAVGHGQTRSLFLLAIVDSAQDPVGQASMSSVSPGEITPRDNNVTLRKVTIAGGS